MLAEFVAPKIDWMALSPLLVLLGGGLVLIVVGSLTTTWPKRAYSTYTVAVAVGALVMALVQWHRISDDGPKFLINDALSFDAFSMFGTITILIAIILTALITDDFLRREGMDGPEIYALYLMAAIGGLVMVMSNDLIVLFLGIETLSIALYVLAASHRRRIESQESGIKYFVLGSFSSAFFLYGVALIYGGTGSTNFNKILAAFDNVPAERKDTLVLVGVGLLMVGLFFKVAAAPFHFWTPDVYEGAPTPVTAFLASAGKVAGFAAMLRVLVVALPTWRDDWRPVIWIVAVITLCVGAILAVVQTNVKRMLAYSSISHAGFILIGVEAAGHVNGSTGKGMPSSMLYLLLYTVLVCGTFGVVTLVGRTGDNATYLDSFRGLSKQKPLLAVAMTVFLLAQAGVPFTSGFVAKFGVIRAAADSHSYAIAIIAMLSSVISAFLYLRILISVWMIDPTAEDDKAEAIRVPLSSGVAIGAAMLFTLAVGIYPQWLITASEKVTQLAGR
ncbi:MAG: NADH-quinone oxidoreductase subunit N [Ilumatobacteraceae bacterium]